jgi:hypothetical protein
MSLEVIYGVFCGISEKDMPGLSNIKDEKEKQNVYEIWRQHIIDKINEAVSYDKDINRFFIDFANSEDLDGYIIGIKLKTVTVQYSGGIDITDIESKVTHEIKNKIKNMIIETNLFNYVKSTGKIWVYLDLGK